MHTRTRLALALRVTLVLPAALALACAGTDAPPATGAGSPEAGGTVETFDGNRIAYESHGAGEPTVVLVHCWACDRSFWREQVGPLAERYRVVALDLPGHGASTADRETWTIAALGRDVATAVEALGLERVVLVGHSMGGPVSLEAARLLGGTAIGVVAVDTLHDADFRWPEEQMAQLLAAYDADFAGTCRNFVGTMFVPESDPALRDRVTAEMCDAPPEVAVALLRDFPGYDMAAGLAGAGVPVRAVNASSFPTAVETNRRYADFDAVVLEGVGHFLQLEDPARVNPALVAAIEELAGP